MTRQNLLIALAVFILGFALAFIGLKRLSATVVVKRVFPAPVEKVWQVWTDVESMKQWWGPKDFTAPVIVHDFREGGKFLYSMKDPGGRTIWNAGTYTKIVPQAQIVYILSFSDDQGNLVPASLYGIPGDWPDAMNLDVQFQNLDGKTKVTITETGIPAIIYIFAQKGWNQQLDKLEALLK